MSSSHNHGPGHPFTMSSFHHLGQSCHPFTISGQSPCHPGPLSSCHPQVTRPEELSQKVFLILLETTVARGASTPGQIRRSYLSLQHDHQGRREVRVHGNVRRKTMPGRAADYRAIDVTVYGELEVILGQTFLYLGLTLEIPWEMFT